MESDKLSKVGIDLLSDPELKKVKGLEKRGGCFVNCKDSDGEIYEFGFTDDECSLCGADHINYFTFCMDNKDPEKWPYRYCSDFYY